MDCGIVVCYVMRQISQNKAVDPKFSREDARKMRSEVIHKIINDNKHNNELVSILNST